jgi:uncharacterized membrane protein
VTGDQADTTDVGRGANGAIPERRWPMALAVLAAVALQVGSPHRGRLPGWWVFPVIEVAVLLLIVAADPGRIDRRTRVSRGLTFALIAIMTVGTAGGLMVLLYDIINSVKGVTATVLLGRGAALWVTNVIVFSLWFWEIDRGGPAERFAGAGVVASFAFPENAMPEFAPKAWMPRYPDYLYLSFTNATAFSPTDTLPVKTWAKMTMMLESAISLVTAILVIARAINVLPG